MKVVCYGCSRCCILSADDYPIIGPEDCPFQYAPVRVPRNKGEEKEE